MRSTIELEAPPDVVLRFLGDVSRWSAWIKRLDVSELLPGQPPAFHLLFDAPWPFANRDYAIAPALFRDAFGNPIFHWESASERLPPPAKGVLRVRVIRGGFVIQNGRSPNSSRLAYSDVAVLGGKLPTWAIRESYKRGPLGILGALRRELERLRAPSP